MKACEHSGEKTLTPDLDSRVLTIHTVGYLPTHLLLFPLSDGIKLELFKTQARF